MVRNRGALGNRLEYRLDVARRTGDQVQDFGRRGLLLKRRRQLLRERRNPLLHASAQYCHLQPPVRGAPARHSGLSGSANSNPNETGDSRRRGPGALGQTSDVPPA